MTRISVIDFETTGLSPCMGDHATEVAIVMLEGGVQLSEYSLTPVLVTGCTAKT